MDELNDNKLIRVRLLGELSFFTADWNEWKRVDVKRAGLVWSIIVYLILNRTRNVSSEQLIETFWQEEPAGDPDGVLRHAIHRCRGMLEKFGFADAKSLIVSTSGGYAWNPKQPTEVDCEEFEKMRSGVRHVSDDEKRLNIMLKMIKLYNGDFWISGKTVWGNSLQIYYRTQYSSTCQEAVAALKIDNRWNDIIDICTRAVVIDPTVEQLSADLMQALVALNQPERALEHYSAIKTVLAKQYGVEPSEAVELARASAAGAREGRVMGSQDIIERLRAVGVSEGAYLCDYPIFARIAALEARHAVRSGKDVPVVLIRIGLEIRENSGSGRMATEMKRMERTLLATLRTSDPFTRLSPSQFLLLLPDASMEAAAVVMYRVEAQFRRSYPYSGALINYEVFSAREVGEPG